MTDFRTENKKVRDALYSVIAYTVTVLSSKQVSFERLFTALLIILYDLKTLMRTLLEAMLFLCTNDFVKTLLCLKTFRKNRFKLNVDYVVLYFVVLIFILISIFSLNTFTFDTLIQFIDL